MARLVLTLACAVALISFVGPATGGSLGEITNRYEATLTVGAEVPRPTGVRNTAYGQFVGVYIKRSRTLVWILRFGHLTTDPDPASAAHIHIGKPGKAGRVLIPLCGPCPRPSHGTVRLTLAQALQFRNRPLYVNIHTAKNQAGEIRGTLYEPSEPRPGCQPC